MLGNMFTHTVHVPGTLAANITVVFTVPVDCTLIHASAVGSNANNGLLILGNTSNDDAYLESASIGDSSAPAEFAQSNFVGGQFPRLLKGTVFSATLDFDGASGTATANFTLSLTFLEG